MKRRDFLRSIGVGAATTVAVRITNDDALDVAFGMDDEVDPDLEDFVKLLNSLMEWNDRPGWIVVPEKTYKMLEMELVPSVRYMAMDVANFGYENLLIKGIPIIPLQSRRTP